MRWRPRSMLAGNLALLIPLVIASQACALAIWWYYVQQPRTEDAAVLIAAQIRLADDLLAALPPDERHARLQALSAVPTATLDDLHAGSGMPDGPLLRRFFTRLRAEAPPGVELRWQQTADARYMWVRLRSSDALWLGLTVDGADSGGLGATGRALLLLSLTAFPTLGAWLIHRRVSRPLADLAGAAREIESGRWPDTVVVRGPRELATVIEAFNGMSGTLAESDRTRAEMLAGISHDIRTPLTKLRMVTASPETFEGAAASAERFVEQIDLIVGQFIDFARGSADEPPQRGDLNALVEQLAGGHAALGHDFALDLQPLPPQRYRPVALQRLLMNLMQNAVNHGGAGLAVSTRWHDGAAEVRVEDRGPGVPADLLAHMKQPFRRGGRGSVRGAGLGLAIAERVAREHGGTLELQPRPGGGLSVVLRLPPWRDTA